MPATLSAPSYLPKYTNDWALVIGINEYTKAPTLGYARQDAEGFANLIESKFGFKHSNITLLTDKKASRKAITAAFLQLARDKTSSNDRVIIFFAGHGHTESGHRGEIGYLVPANGDPNNLSTLIRWDELTHSDLIAAKHILFVMDACYGGLAYCRSLPPGSSRFLKNMLQRRSRQVITAGKADEVVADSGGPRPGHSMFTGHLLDALEGGAATPDGIISANSVMQYVYERVAKDVHSKQTPHFGFLDGDGDFIFHAPQLALLTADEKFDTDVLIELPGSTLPALPSQADLPSVALLKDYLSDPRYRIRLDDAITAQIRGALDALREDTSPSLSDATALQKPSELLSYYEHAIEQLAVATGLVARWGDTQHQMLLQNILSRLADLNIPKGGLVVLLGLRWYPLMFLMYVGGIAAISSKNYRSLSTLLTIQLASSVTGDGNIPAVVATVEGIVDVDRHDFFKKLPGHEHNFVPRSEYMFKAVQPRLEDVLFLGKAYEDYFDRFEILYALAFADAFQRKTGDAWAPAGRFGWKQCSIRFPEKPYDSLVKEATQQGANWDVIQHGLFDGSIERFKEIASAYRERLKKLPWY